MFLHFCTTCDFLFLCLFICPSSAANQINGVKGKGYGNAQLWISMLGTFKWWFYVIGHLIRSAVLIWWSCCPFIVWQTLVHHWIEWNRLCESNFGKKHEKWRKMTESSLNYLSTCKRRFLMKDERCHAQLFVSLYFFYSNTITIWPLLVAEAILKKILV